MHVHTHSPTLSFSVSTSPQVLMLPWYRRWNLPELHRVYGCSPLCTRSDPPGQPCTADAGAPNPHKTHTHTQSSKYLSVRAIISVLLRLEGGSTRGSDLGGAFGRAVESGAAEEKVDFLPGFTAGFFHVKKTLNLWTCSRPQQVLQAMLL